MHSNDSRTVNCLSNVATGGILPLAFFFLEWFSLLQQPLSKTFRYDIILLVVERSIIV